MRKSLFEELVATVLDRLPRPYSEDVTLDVFETIEKDPALLRDYDSLCMQFDTPRMRGQTNVNQSIVYWVMKKIDRSAISRRHRSDRSRLIQTYSRLG